LARNDIREALIWSRERFGENAAGRYRDLIRQALVDLAADPERPGSAERRELARGIRTYHLVFSRDRVGGAAGVVRRPRHFVVYRCWDGDRIEIVRVLHDARELELHLPGEAGSDAGLAGCVFRAKPITIPG
jgi:toxin ParE1/3/4